MTSISFFSDVYQMQIYVDNAILHCQTNNNYNENNTHKIYKKHHQINAGMPVNLKCCYDT